jgi:hypothetical protein
VAPLDRSLKPDSQQSARQVAACPAERPRVTDGGGSAESTRERDPSAGKPNRFSPPDEPLLRVREDAGGQPFIRCLVCHYDNPVGATLCALCDADLTTSAQRSFNKTEWDRSLQERAECKRQADCIAAEQRKLNREHARTMQELARLQRGQSLHPRRRPWLFRIFQDR